MKFKLNKFIKMHFIKYLLISIFFLAIILFIYFNYLLIGLKNLSSFDEIYCYYSNKYQVKIFQYQEKCVLKNLSFLKKEMIFENTKIRDNIKNEIIIKGNFNNETKIKANKDIKDDWLRSHKNYYSNKHSNLKLIDKKNIKKLDIAWEHVLINKKKNVLNKIYNYFYTRVYYLFTGINPDYHSIQTIGANPIYFEKKLFLPDLENNLLAIDAKNGQLIWKKKFPKPVAKRGLVLDNSSDISILYVPTVKGIYAVDPNNGKILNLYRKELQSINLINKYGINATIGKGVYLIPPIITETNIIAANMESEVISFEKKTGDIEWITSLRNKEFDSGSHPWGGMSYDSNRKTIYLVTGNPSNKKQTWLFGLLRKGKNYYSNSIVAIDENNGSIKWHFQDISHDLWDLDISFPPILTSLKKDNKMKDVLVTISKAGNTIIIDRDTGKSVFDYKLIKTPISSIPNEVTSIYQPRSISPQPLISLKINEKDLSNLSNEINSYVLNEFAKGKSDDFLPPIINKKIFMNGVSGGGQWYGGSVDKNNILYAPINNVPWYLLASAKVEKTNKNINENDIGRKNFLKNCASCHGNNRSNTNNDVKSLAGITLLKYKEKKQLKKIIANKHNKIANEESYIDSIIEYLIKADKINLKNGELYLDMGWGYFNDQYGNLATKPPWGFLYAIDLDEGEIKWKRPYGKINAKISENDYKIVEGSPIWGGILSTSSEIIIASGSFDSKLYFYDTKNGNEIHNIQLEAPGSSPPITYLLDNEQYIAVIAVGAGKTIGTGYKIYGIKLFND